MINVHNKKLAEIMMAQTGEVVAVRRDIRDILVCKIDLISIQTSPKCFNPVNRVPASDRQ